MQCSASPLRFPLRILVLCGPFIACVTANASPATTQGGYTWQDLLTNKVLACIVAAVALLIISLLLRGLLKVISLAIVVLLAVAGFWFFRDGWNHRAELLPSRWAALAENSIESPKAQAAWRSLRRELSGLSKEARARLAAGTDDAKHALLSRLDAKATELRKAGDKAEAGEISRLRELIAEER